MLKEVKKSIWMFISRSTKTILNSCRHCLTMKMSPLIYMLVKLTKKDGFNGSMLQQIGLLIFLGWKRSIIFIFQRN